jgi:hypothetical protein
MEPQDDTTASPHSPGSVRIHSISTDDNGLGYIEPGADFEPSLPYAGTSGNVNVDTSRDATIHADMTGITAAAQRYVLIIAGQQRGHGVTVGELRERNGSLHHGRISGALSDLHKAGRLVALRERRGNPAAGVYVLPEHVEGREARPFRPNKKRIDPEVINGVILHHPRTYPLGGLRMPLYHCGCGWSSNSEPHNRHLAEEIAEALS